MNLENRVFHKNLFLIIQVETGEVWGCPGGAHGAYEDIPPNFGRIYLVLHVIGKSTFQHLTVNWNFNVLEMALKTFHIVQGHPGHLSYLFLDISPTYVLKKQFEKKSIENRKSGSLTNQVKVSLFVSARTIPCKNGISNFSGKPNLCIGKD